MSGMRRRRAEMTEGGHRRLSVLLLAIASLAAILAPSARAAVGYELDPVTPTHSLDGVPRGLAVDQANQDLYVAIITKNFSTLASGQIERFNSDLSADGTFAPGPYYSGVAVNPVTHGFYGAEVEFHTQFGNFGASKLDRFSSAGTLLGSTAVAYPNAFPTIAADSAGDVFFPNREKHSVQVFDSAGVLKEEITCGGCTGGQFGAPISVAVNASDDLYVADAAPDRVIKLTSSGGPYSFGSVLQSGRGAGAVGVDPGTGDVLVGDLPNGKDFHIVAYTSSGTQFDDFGRGLFADPTPEAGISGASQMAVDGTTHRVYVDTFEKFYVFDRVTINPPTATIGSATNVAQLSAKLNATVNTGGHAVLECEFEYTDDADFQANGYANATTAPCSSLPYSTADTAVEAKASGLQPATTYHFRVTATNNAGAASSGSEAFETLPVVPATVTTEPPTAVTQTGATLEGVVNPHGGSASNCHFELGTGVSYGTNLSCSSLPAAISSDVPENRSASQLVHDTTYHYRLVVTTNAGTVKGNDVEFTSASPPTDPESPTDPTPPPPDTTPAPPPVVTPPPSGGPVATPRPLHCKKGFRKRRIHGKLRCVKKRPLRSP
jgi:hypothetical protein